MAETVESVLNEKKQSDYFEKLYKGVSDIRGFTQDATLELMLSNEQVEGITSSLKSIEKQISISSKEIINAIKSVKASGLSDVIDAEYVDLNEGTVQKMADSYSRALVPMMNKLPAMVEASNSLVVSEMQESTGYLSRLADPTWALPVIDRELNDKVQTMSDMLYQSRDDSPRSMATDMESVKLANEDMVYYLREQSRFLESIYGELKKPDPKPLPEKPNKPKDDGEGLFGGLLDDMLGLFGLSSAMGKLKGFFGKMAKRWTNTLKGVGGVLDNVFAKLFGAIGKVAKFFKIDKLFNLLAKPFKFIGKILKKIPGIGKLFEFLGKGFGKLLPFVKGGFKFAKAIPVIGWVITAVSSLFDFAGGLKDADKIIGKNKKDLNLMDKINAGLSGLISGLTLGIVNPKTIYRFIKMFEDALEMGFTSLWNMLPSSMKDSLKGFWGFLFDKEKGILGAIPGLIEGILDQMAGGHYMKAIWNTLLLIPKSIVGVIPRIFNFVVDKASQMMSKLTEFSDSVGLSKLLQPIVDGITAPIKAIFEMIGNLIPGNIMNKIKETTGSLGKSLSGAFESTMNWASGDSEKRNAKLYDYQSSVDGIKKLMDAGDSKGANAEYKKLLTAYNKDPNIKQDPVLAGDVNKKLQDAYNVVSSKPSSVPEAGRSMKLAKDRMDQKQQAPAVTVTPVVVPMPQPEKQSVTRRKEGSMDKGLAFANYSGGG